MGHAARDVQASAAVISRKNKLVVSTSCKRIVKILHKTLRNRDWRGGAPIRGTMLGKQNDERESLTIMCGENAAGADHESHQSYN